jgi:RimJ/RimL family protein N-acetyltransferase
LRLAWGDPAFDQAVADYVLSHFPTLSLLGRLKPFRAVAMVDDDGNIRGGLVMTDYRFFDAELSIYMEPKVHFGLHMLREMFAWAFGEVDLKRLTCRIGVENKRAQRFVEKAGFRYEGTMRLGLDGIQDAQIYGMTQQDCIWLTGKTD